MAWEDDFGCFGILITEHVTTGTHVLDGKHIDSDRVTIMKGAVQ
jgi:hypothetical protein